MCDGDFLGLIPIRKDILQDKARVRVKFSSPCFSVQWGAPDHLLLLTVSILDPGLLDPVTDLTSEYYNDYNQILNWTPPFTLDITDLDPDISNYTICNSASHTCVNTTDTSYIFPTTCFPVEYSVSACNPVGCSEIATVLYPIGRW